MNRKNKKITKLEKVVEANPNFQFIQNGKIKCTLTGHQFMPTQQNFIDHLKSKSYKKASEALFDISEYEDVLTTHKDGKNFLFCRMTGAKLPKKKTAIEKHVQSRKFQRRFEQYKTKVQNVEGQGSELQFQDQQDGQEQEQILVDQPVKKNKKQIIQQEQEQHQQQQDVQLQEEESSEEEKKIQKKSKKNKKNGGKRTGNKNQKFNQFNKTRK